MRRFVLPALALAVLTLAPAARAGSVITTVDFEDFPLPTSGYNNDSGGFSLDGNFFNNKYEFDADWNMEFWAGWAVTNHDDNTTPGFGNQYSAITGGGADGSSQYAIAFDGGTFGGAYIDLADGQLAHAVDVTNTTYTYYSIVKGDQFTPAFTSGDYFLLTITGFEGLGGAGAVTNSVNVYLADYRDGREFALDTWETVDLTELGDARSLSFTFSGSKTDFFGLLTPTYAAVDNFQTIGPAPSPSPAVPEPAGLVLLSVGLVGALGLARRRK